MNYAIILVALLREVSVDLERPRGRGRVFLCGIRKCVLQEVLEDVEGGMLLLLHCGHCPLLLVLVLAALS